MVYALLGGALGCCLLGGWVLLGGAPNARAQGHTPALAVKGYHATSYDVRLRLDRQADSLDGVVTMRGYAAQPITEVIQHAKYLTIDSVRINGQDAAFLTADTTSGEYAVFPVQHTEISGTFTLTTYYHGHGRPEQYGTMAWGGVTQSDTMMFAMGVGFAAPYTSCTRHWLPCYDLPDDKPDSVDLTFITPARDLTASNGLLLENTVTGATRTMHWHVSRPIATYLLTFATGPYTVQHIQNTLGVPFEVYALKRDSAAAAVEMNVRVREVLRFYDSLFAPYPFEKVGYVVTPIGSMEHQTMISLVKSVLTQDSAARARDTTGGSTTAIHELAHMWFGDRVTCETFDDAWLNEGFATYCESLVLERLFGRGKYVSRQRSNVAGAKQSTLPLFGAPTVDKHTDNYPYTTIYQKGAAVLGMLRQYLGDSVFFAAIRYYGDRHAYSTSTSNDLWQDVEHVAGQDLGWFFRPWLAGYGYPKDTVTWTPTAGGAHITFHQQVNNAATPYYRIAIPVRGLTKGGLSKTVTVWMDSTALSSFDADLGFMPDTILIDPEGLLIMRTVKVTRVAAGVTDAPTGDRGSLYYNVYPNPDHDHPIEFELGGAAGASGAGPDYSVDICDVTGRCVRQSLFETAAETIHGSVDLAGLPSGSYRIAVSSKGRLLAASSFTYER